MTAARTGDRTDADTRRPPPRLGFAWALALVTGAGAILRLVVVVGARNQRPSADGFMYSYVADGFADGRGFVSLTGAETALHPPAWSFVLSIASRFGADGVFAHQIVAALVGTVTVLLLGLVGRRVGGRRVGLLAAGIAAVSPHLWLWERELAAITLVLPLLAAGVLLTYEWIDRPRRWIPPALGLVGGALVLTRSEQAVAFAGFLTVAVLAGRTRHGWRSSVAGVLVASLVAAALAAPWLLSNRERFEEPVLLATGSGVTLAYANNERTYDGPLLGYGDPGVWDQMMVRPGDESQQDAYFREVGLDHLGANLDDLPAVVAARHARTWGVFDPAQQVTLDQSWGNSSRAGYWAGYVVGWLVLVGAVAGAFVAHCRGLKLAPLVVTLVVVVLNVTLTYGQTRYRVPAMILLVPLAALAVDQFVVSRSSAALVPTRPGTRSA